MSKRTRALVVGVMLAAMNLAGLTAVAQAQTSDEPASNQNARRPPTERQVGEPYRSYHEALAAQAQTAQDDAVERFRRSERASMDRPILDKATEQAMAQQRRWYYQSTHPVSVPAAPAASSERPGQPVALIAALVAAAVLARTLDAMSVRRKARKAAHPAI
jgi:hypothetical protein